MPNQPIHLIPFLTPLKPPLLLLPNSVPGNDQDLFAAKFTEKSPKQNPEMPDAISDVSSFLKTMHMLLRCFFGWLPLKSYKYGNFRLTE